MVGDNLGPAPFSVPTGNVSLVGFFRLWGHRGEYRWSQVIERAVGSNRIVLLPRPNTAHRGAPSHRQGREPVIR